MPRVTRAEVRDRVVEAAATVFAEKGIAATRMQDVAATAGFTRGAVYSNFADKADLLAAVVDATSDRMAVDGTAVFDPAVPPSALRAGIGRLVADWVREVPVHRRLQLELVAQATRDEDLRATLVEPRRRRRRAVAAAATAYFDSRGMPLPLPADVFATALLAVVNAFAIELLIDPEGTTPTAVADALSVLVPG
ncbi:TetR family transcriptional regulator [Actinokineospora sp. PR83]|uniref:TetR/AcrR family transcriptional regulator n=1 Tax=Actinokineospora sp. PR83 TaxID=2884908 RepID=UPI001F30245F|nr:TetR/AcrR family transcriptional regulator [Actinokineospora sp. PR83]MCG8917311.1 TetR family transcriptional regulator [Actinokineospora sp. PR83]